MGRAANPITHMQSLPKLETSEAFIHVLHTPSCSANGVTIINFTPAILPLFFLCSQPRSNHSHILVTGGKCYLTSISEQSQVQRADSVKTLDSTVSSSTKEIAYNTDHGLQCTAYGRQIRLCTNVSNGEFKNNYLLVVCMK